MGIPPAPRGMPQIEVTFDIDANGILNVSAKDTATNKEQKITITASTGLSKEEAERMQKEADAHAAEDKARLAEVEARNRLDNLVYQMEKLIKENREKLAEADVKAVEEAIEEARRALTEAASRSMNAADEKLDEGVAPHGGDAVQGAAERGQRLALRAQAHRVKGQRAVLTAARVRAGTRRSDRRRVRGRGRIEEAELTLHFDGWRGASIAGALPTEGVRTTSGKVSRRKFIDE